MTTNQPSALDTAADLLLVTNNATTTLNGGINAAVTSLVVADGTVFPASNFLLSIGTEILLCSSRTGNTLTVVRAQEGTSAATHANGAAVVGNMTAGHYETLRGAIIGTQQGYMRRDSVNDVAAGGISRPAADPLEHVRRFAL